MEHKFSKEQIRSIVRDALREATSQRKAGPQNKSKTSDSPLGRKILASSRAKSKSPILIKLESSKLLNEFVKELIACAQDENIRSLVLSGKVEFDLEAGSTNGVKAGKKEVENYEVRSGDYLQEHGILNESKILKLAKEYQRIVLGKGAVLTPLAKDRARAVKLEIVREQT